jgi:predicted nucleic acid-binding protein
MDPILLDTDVFSFLFKRDSRGRLYESDILGHQLCLSFQSVAELRSWTLAHRWGSDRVSRLEQVIHTCIVLPFDDQVCTQWAQITSIRRARR